MADDLEINYRFDCEALGGAVPPLSNVHLVEALNVPYALRVDAVLTEPGLEAASLVGQDCVIELGRGQDTVRRVCGVIREVREADAPEQAQTRLAIVPALWFLSQRRDTRIFQSKTVPQILEEVLGALGDYGRSVTLELTASYPTREYCVQYQESDLDFAHRLMEEEGISYTFDHEGDVEVMVLRDANASFPEIPSGKTIAYQPHDLELRGPEPIVHFVRGHAPTTTAIAARDWDWTRGGNMVVEAEAAGEDRDGRTRESYQHGRGRSLSIWSYDQGVRRYQQEDGASVVTVRQQAAKHLQVVAVGISRAVGMAPGVIFELGGHPTVGMDGEYLVIGVEHVSGGLTELLPDSGVSDPYYNRFECIPIATEYRPLKVTAKPFIPSIQTAVTTGPSGEEIHVDEHGRIKVQFHWDRVGANDEKSSCWIRVQQPWAGSGWGFWWVPRIGMEVVVHFVDGDPDRPLVTATVYDGANPTPYGLPDEKTKSTIKSNSSLGGGGFNELRFEDKKGQEEIYSHAQKDYNEVVEHDHNTLVHHDQTNTVDNDQTQTVHVDQSETVHANQRMTVDGNRTVHVKSNFDETVDGTETRHTVGDVTETFDANEDRTITANLGETIGGDETRDITGNQDETVGGSYSQTITGSSTESITGSLSETIVGGITTTTPASYDITAVGGMTVTAVGGIKIIAPGGLHICSPAGVTQVDEFYKWLGVQQIAIGILNQGIAGLKMEMTLSAFGVTGMAFSDTGIELTNEALDMTQKAAHVVSGGAKMVTGALRFVAKAVGIKA